ncbi:MAG: DNA-binding response regulator, partial [Rhodobacteraceae bacterium]|nr:DNA-binding response regulator [Paracoccaceae bacterium]
CASIVSHFHFPVMPRTIATWPLVARRPNRCVVYEVSEVLEFEDIKLFPGSKTVERGGVRINLGPKEFRILSLLMERPGQVFSRIHVDDIAQVLFEVIRGVHG